VETVVAVGVLGSHPARIPDAPGLWDAVDLVIETDTGASLLFGVRTAAYLDRLDTDDPDAIEDWNGYHPLAVTLDRSSVIHWNFSEVLWLGPELRPCLIWSNATALNLEAVVYLLSAERGGILLKGPDDAGLPRPSDLGVTVPEDLERHRVGS
jgi:hypothetical protein